MAVLVYMTASSEDEARTIGNTLIEKRLAACVNILGSAQSLFRWNGSIQSENEIAFIAKTTQERMAALIAEVKHLHSYEVPCIVALPILAGNSDFLEWITRETSQSTES